MTGYTFVLPKTAIDLVTGHMTVQWPAHDSRDTHLAAIFDQAKREMTLAFIAGYRTARPDASDDDVMEAVILWAQR